MNEELCAARESLIDPLGLRAVFAYDATTGQLSRIRRAGRGNARESVGWVDRKGYLRLELNKRSYAYHRVAWAVHYGEWPRGEIDHVNGVKSDNRIENLRVTRQSGNMANRPGWGKHKKGAYKTGNRFRSVIWKGGKLVGLGTFDTEDEAHAAYCRAALELHGDFANFAHQSDERS
jgi:hypothetical protein